MSVQAEHSSNHTMVFSKRRPGSLVSLYKNLKRGTAVMRVPFKKRQWSYRSVISKSVRPEIKYLYLSTVAVPAVGGVVGYMNNMAQGATSITRVGDRATSLYWHYDINILPPTGGSQDSVLVSILIDRSNNNVDPVYGDIFDIINFTPAAGFKNVFSFDRFVILKNIELGPINMASINNPHTRGFIKIPVALAQSMYKAGGTRPVQNSLMFAVITANNTGAAATSCSVTINGQFAFRDA